MIDLSTAEARTAAAGEYVLGTLDDADRSAMADALDREPSLLADVYAWQDRLLALSLQAAPAQPTASLWQRIERSMPADGAAPARRDSVAAPGRWWQRAAAWQAFGATGLLVALVLAVALVQRAQEPTATPERYLAVLQSPADRSAGWVVEVSANRRLRLVPMTPTAAVPPDKAPQFWTKPQGAAAPTSLGLVRPGATVELALPDLPGAGEQQLFEITLEPRAGSPIGRPTGPILYVGRAVHV